MFKKKDHKGLQDHYILLEPSSEKFIERSEGSHQFNVPEKIFSSNNRYFLMSWFRNAIFFIKLLKYKRMVSLNVHCLTCLQKMICLKRTLKVMFKIKMLML